jgi:intracellular sulfur oxidation DsrE/DsrF family protein
VVLHGPAAFWLRNEEAYQTHTLDPFAINPNDKVVEELLDHGVSMEICHITTHRAHQREPHTAACGVHPGNPAAVKNDKKAGSRGFGSVANRSCGGIFPFLGLLSGR